MTLWSVATGLILPLAAGVAMRGDGPASLDALRAHSRRPAASPYPANNTYSSDRERLGRTLFFDPRLSGSGWISCASCHNPGLSWADGLPRAIGRGRRTLGRHTPTLLNVAWAPTLFWDGRERLRGVSGYRELFAHAYGDQSITADTIAKALATFERSIVSARAPFDAWVEGDANALPADARRGFALVTATCAAGSTPACVWSSPWSHRSSS